MTVLDENLIIAGGIKDFEVINKVLSARWMMERL